MFEIDFPSERAIEDFVFHQIEQEGLCPISGEQVDLCLRQHEIKAYGRTDIIKLYWSPGLLEIVILELKNKPLCELHLSQLARYMVGARRQAARYQKRFPNYEILVRGQLAGPFEKGLNDIVWMLECIEGIEFYALTMDMKTGFRSESLEQGWHKTQEDLQGGKSVAKHVFHGIADLERAEAEAAHHFMSAQEEPH
tara:strand:+ start:2605 stop:3192 length:588 start_codon:yes stop_codon:yes gene_type:complete